MEPSQLKRGREFQKEVQQDYIANTKGGGVEKEIEVNYIEKNERTKGNYGRMDIFLDDSDAGYVVIYEIKATDWDKIKPKNRIRNLYRHGRQLHKYIDKFIKEKHKNRDVIVVHGVLYPFPPITENLRIFIEETAFDRYAFPVYWYSEMQSTKGSE